MRDASQDVDLKSMTRTGSKVVVEAKRSLGASDDKDRPIPSGPIDVVCYLCCVCPSFDSFDEIKEKKNQKNAVVKPIFSKLI